MFRAMRAALWPETLTFSSSDDNDELLRHDFEKRDVWARPAHGAISFAARAESRLFSLRMSAAPLPSLSPAELSRYSRHILLAEIGVEGQRKLAAARVLIVGAGGLGSPAALYLAAAGVGTLGLADFDRVEEHNLQRQLLHDTSSVGKLKTESASARLSEVNPFVRVQVHNDGVTVANALELFSHYDVIVDGSDNFATRYLNNDAAFLARKPLVYGSIFKFEGQVSVFDPARGGPCYRCLFPEPPAAGSVPNCGEAGVLGALCGVIGSLQALEAIKLIVGFGEPLIGRLLTYDALRQQFTTLTLPRDPDCPLCGHAPTITGLLPEIYQATCAPQQTSENSMSSEQFPLEISVEETKRLLDTAASDVQLIDVREAHEVEICRIAGAQHIPMRQIPEHLGDLPNDKHLLIHCHHGGRSLRVTEFLRSRGFAAVSNVAGGIDAWALQIDPSLRRY
jgi:sulfur-carrier protein adenylyltransferase/sulfurtransferase